MATRYVHCWPPGGQPAHSIANRAVFSQQKQAQATLNQVGFLSSHVQCFAPLTPAQFKENPDAWLLVDKILSDAQYPQTKCECKQAAAQDWRARR